MGCLSMPSPDSLRYDTRFKGQDGTDAVNPESRASRDGENHDKSLPNMSHSARPDVPSKPSASMHGILPTHLAWVFDKLGYLWQRDLLRKSPGRVHPTVRAVACLDLQLSI